MRGRTAETQRSQRLRREEEARCLIEDWLGPGSGATYRVEPKFRTPMRTTSPFLRDTPDFTSGEVQLQPTTLSAQPLRSLR